MYSRALSKGKLSLKSKCSPVVVFEVLSPMVLVWGSSDAPFLLYSQSNSRTSTETGWLRPTRWGFVCKMSLKAPFRSYKARMTAIDSYVVVFWMLSRLVLVRKRCDATFLLYSQSNMAEQVVTCSCVHQSPGHRACRLQLTACLIEFLSLELNLGVKIVACGRGDQVTGVRTSTWPLVQPCSIGNKGGTLHRCLFGPKPVYNIWANHGPSCFYKNEMALLVTFCIPIPI